MTNLVYVLYRLCAFVVFAIGLSCLLSFSAHADGPSLAYTPEVVSPRLTYLDTTTGLSQDTVEAILVDSEGFLWLGTEDGLDRYDGHEVVKVSGQNNMLDNNPVYYIHEFDQRYLILSTGLNGILKFDKTDGSVTELLNLPYRDDADWPQYSDAMMNIDENRVLVALNESIHSIDMATNKTQSVFALNDAQIDAGESIRAFYVHKNTYFIGTTLHLWAFNTTSGVLQLVPHTPSDNVNAHNVKHLSSPTGKKLWVGTVQGLYELDIAQLMNHLYADWTAPQIKVLEANRNIWQVAYRSPDKIYVATDLGLFLTSADASEFKLLFELNKQFEVLSHPDVMDLAFDRAGNIWMATYVSGAMLWSPRSLAFTNIFASTNAKAKANLSHNSVQALFQNSSSEMWIGTENGLNRLDLNSQSLTQYLVSDDDQPDYTSASILEIEPYSRDVFWVAHGEGVTQFDTQSGQLLDNARFSDEIATVLNQYAFSILPQGREILWVSNEQGIHRIDFVSQTVRSVETSSNSFHNAAANYMHFLGFDAVSGQILVSGTAQLWGIDQASLAPSLLHSAADDGANMMTKPSSFIRDTNNNVWLAYTGLGLYQLDGRTFSELALFNKSNQLSTTVIYGLALDGEGDIWFSSHSGIHSLSTSDFTVQSFGFASGLASAEFNEGAHLHLADGRLAYGGNLGFSIFNPLSLKSKDSEGLAQPVITSVSVANRELALPFTDLHGQAIVLEPDDIGLTLKFSMLNFAQYGANRFQYSITRAGRTTNYPPVNSNQILLPTLEPGDYKIEVRPATGPADANLAAFIMVSVKHQPWASPWAVVAYCVLAATVFLMIVWRRHKVQRVINAANKKVAQYNIQLTDALKASNADIWQWQSDTNTISGKRLVYDLELPYESLDFDEFTALIHPEDKQEYLKNWAQFIAQQDTQLDVTYRLIGLSGKSLWYRDVGSLKTLGEGIRSVSGTYTNLTESVAAKEKLKVFGEAFNHTRDWVLIFDSKLRPIAANPSFMQAFGIDSRRPLDVQIQRINQEHEDELKLLHNHLKSLKAGDRYKTEANVHVLQNKLTLLADVKAIEKQSNRFEIDHYLCIFTDITDQIEAQRALQKLANYDVLTGLINRSLLIERLKQGIHYSKRHLEKLAVLFVDLDRFKPINDSFGHEAGDQVLMEVARRLASKFRGQDSVARIGGDEFIIVLSEVKDKEAIDKICRDVLKIIEKPVSIGHQAVNISASIGVALYPDHANDAEHLVRNADIAMYSAKQQGKNAFSYFVPSMNDKVHADMLLENKIKVALAQNEFINFYQPIIDITTAKTAGFELLMRWFDEDKMIPPDVFIPVAEQIGCIVEMTEQAIYRAVADLAQWYQQGFTGYVAINLSAKHFNRAFNADSLMGLLAKYNLPPHTIRFEITESLLMENSHKSVTYMNELRELGFKISLDDFGTGYSSLKYLKDFPIDVLKLDKSFVKDVLEDKATSSIVYSTLIMAELLALDTVAEGIESEQQFRYFQASKCRMLQGYYFSRPIPVEQTYDMLNRSWFEQVSNDNTNIFSIGSSSQT
ncbi:EAL domain-containing protein [Glaciecola siphonariae]|uniref:EAL domain-containing protein n=1 Tax=Glaciecola siphonariae TaxID=521012 RepID=A0ABV9LUT8_9ALTE